MSSTTHGLPELPVWLGVCIIALVLSIAPLLDHGPSEIEAAQAVFADLQDAIKSAAINVDTQRARGQNDHKTIVVAVQP